MKISEAIAQWQDESIRIKYGPKIAEVFSGVSLATLRDFQNNFVPLNPDDDGATFFKQQQEEFSKCLKLECSSIGKMVRDTMGMKPLNEDYELD